MRSLELKAGPARIGGGHGWTTDGLAGVRRPRAPIMSRAGKIEAVQNERGRHALIRAEGGGDDYDSWSMSTGMRGTRGFGPRIRKPGFRNSVRRGRIPSASLDQLSRRGGQASYGRSPLSMPFPAKR